MIDEEDLLGAKVESTVKDDRFIGVAIKKNYSSNVKNTSNSSRIAP
jgi:hypothetical protein